jgi:hypothetical protein
VRVETSGGTTRVHDPGHGELAVPDTAFAAALARPADALAAILGRRPWVYLTGDEPLITLAALAATYAPHELGAAPGAAPAGPPGPPAPAFPAPPGPSL